MKTILCDRVSKCYGSVAALTDLSLDVDAGEMFGLIGPDGAGKTTTIRLLCGLLRPERGRVQVMAHDPVRDHRAVSQQIGYLSQRFSLYGDLTIDENLTFFAEIHGVRDHQARRQRLLDMTQLTPFRSRLADRLSGGMKQKLALACTLVHQPNLLLLDEATTGVDPISRREFWKLLSEFRSDGITVVMATPYLDEAERCSRVALLHAGRVLALDDPSHLRARFSGEIVEVVATPHRRAREVLRRAPGVADVQSFGDRAHVRLSSPMPESGARDLTDMLTHAGVSVASVRRVPASLEDVFIERVTGHGPAGTPEGAATAAQSR